MDLNGAIAAAERGHFVRDEATMKPGWTVRFMTDEKLLRYFDPKGERAHRITFSDAQRASYQWRVAKADGS